MMSPTARMVRKLRVVARRKTQAEASRDLKVTRQRIHALARDYGIKFREQAAVPTLRMCVRCDYAKGDNKTCLRCKWTPRRIRQLRRRYGLSQVKMSYEILGMNVWAVTRWESGQIKPSRRSLEKLELAEKA